MSTTYDLLYRGGVSKENNIRYLTAETPPTDDNSNKVPTTEWVKEKLDDVEAAMSGGMFPKISYAERSGTRVLVPSGGAWWIYLSGSAGIEHNESKAGGTQLYNPSSTQTAENITKDLMCIKIA